MRTIGRLGRLVAVWWTSGCRLDGEFERGDKLREGSVVKCVRRLKGEVRKINNVRRWEVELVRLIM